MKSNDEIIQLPLAFCVTSRRQVADYKAIFEVIGGSLDSTPRVKRVVLDFEVAVWKAIKEVFPYVELRGCSFYFSQSVYRRVTFLINMLPIVWAKCRNLTSGLKIRNLSP